MGFAALQRDFDHYSTATRVQSKVVASASEVVSITVGKLIRRTNKLVEFIQSMRKVFLGGVQLMARVRKQLVAVPAEEIAKFAELRVAVGRLAKMSAHPMLENPDGNSLVTAAEALDGLTTHSADDGRTTRRLAKKVRDAAELCEAQRIKFHAALVEFDDFLAELSKTSEFADEIDDAYEDAVMQGVFTRHPAIIAHLAK